ncbi:unnamed protein product [Mytilus edulis]|uniref:Uncharacterized protein n=1 Tax=Mytilus edulis TaxID=6550 RepID=A0A8S3R732_MYTED|nr:unnamed protein product [Mytilus edulis]
MPCHLLQSKIPADASANGLQLSVIPEELKSLNILEKQLISQRIPFMKLVQLPKGKERGIIGPCVSIPTDIQKTVTILPRSDDETQLLRCKLKRKQSYIGYSQYEFISTKKIYKALESLKESNPYYMNTSLNHKWHREFPPDFEDLTVVKEDHKVKQEIVTQQSYEDHQEEDQNVKDRGFPNDTCLQPVDKGQEMLDQHFDDIFCVAPGEGSTPVSMMQEKELEQVISKVSIALRKSTGKDTTGNAITASMLTDGNQLKSLLGTDQGYKFLAPIRGTPPYWQSALHDLLATVRQLGIPTWFATFSAADMRWTEVLQLLLEQQESMESLEDLD